MDFDFTNEVITPTTSATITAFSDGSFSLPTGATASRPASPNPGMMRWNTTLSVMEYYNGSAWVNTGRILQVATGSIAASTGTTTIATAVTAVPTITDGFQIWTTSFTPISAASKLLIQFTVTASHGTSNRTIITSCFAGSTNIGSVAKVFATSAAAYPIVYQCVYSPGSTAAITISCRAGATAGGTLSIAQYSGTTNTLGGAAVTEYSIMEIL